MNQAGVGKIKVEIKNKIKDIEKADKKIQLLVGHLKDYLKTNPEESLEDKLKILAIISKHTNDIYPFIPDLKILENDMIGYDCTYHVQNRNETVSLLDVVSHTYDLIQEYGNDSFTQDDSILKFLNFKDKEIVNFDTYVDELLSKTIVEILELNYLHFYYDW